MATYIPYNDRHADLKSGLKTAGAVGLGALTGGWGGAAAGLMGGFGGVGEHYLNQRQRSNQLEGLSKLVGPELAGGLIDQSPQVQLEFLRNHLQDTSVNNDADQARAMAQALGLFGEQVNQGPVDMSPATDKRSAMARILGAQQYLNNTEQYQQQTQKGGFTPEMADLLGAKNVLSIYKQKTGETEERKKFDYQRNKDYQNEVLESHKLHKPRLDLMATSGKEAQKRLELSSKAQDLIKTGKIQGAKGIRAVAEKFGLGQFFANSETQLLNKILNRSILSQASGIGGRVTDDRLKALQAGYTSLQNTPQAMLLQLQEADLEDRKEVAINNARQKLLKKYSGKVLPENFEDMIAEKADKDMQPYEERYQQKFNQFAGRVEQQADKEYGRMNKLFVPGNTFDIEEAAKNAPIGTILEDKNGTEYEKTEQGVFPIVKIYAAEKKPFYGRRWL